MSCSTDPLLAHFRNLAALISMIRIPWFLPMDRFERLLTIERLDLPAVGVSLAAREMASGEVCQGISRWVVGTLSWVDLSQDLAFSTSALRIVNSEAG